MATGDVSKALRDRVRQRVGQASQDGLLPEDIYAFLNRAQYDLGWRLHDAAMPEMTDIASGNLTASRVALPADFWRERTVDVGATNVVATRWNITELDALDDNTLLTPSAANPYYYIWEQAADGATRLLVDVSDAASTLAYRIRYLKNPTDMSDTADPLYKSNKHSMLVEFAVMMYHQMKLNDGERGRSWQQYLAQIIAINTRYMPGYLFQGVPGDTG